MDPEIYTQLHNALKDEADLVIIELKSYLQKRKMVVATIPASSFKIDSKPATTSAAWKLNKVNLVALKKFVEELKLKSYSLSTIRTYRNEFLQLLQLIYSKKENKM